MEEEEGTGEQGSDSVIDVVVAAGAVMMRCLICCSLA
jgi:hypothetical protein